MKRKLLDIALGVGTLVIVIALLYGVGWILEFSQGCPISGGVC